MLRLDEDAVLCDLAETYHVYDLSALPPDTIAALAVGLRSDSRIKLKIAHLQAPLEVFLLATVLDRLNLLLWGENAPPSVAETLREEEPKESNVIAYKSGADFDLARARMLHELGLK